MTYENVTLSLPSELVGNLQAMARARGVAVDDLVRGMLDREAMRLRSVTTAAEARENRVARLHNLLAPEIARATGWADLQARLALYGVDLRSAGNGLMLHDLITHEPLCTGATLGFGDPDLMRRLGGPMPHEVRVAPAA